METFNADNTNCPWDGTSFQPGDEGMKCSSCGAVMKLESFREYEYCRTCNGREAVPVRAVSSSGRTSPRPMGIRLNPSSGVRFGSRRTANSQTNRSSNTPPLNPTSPTVNQPNQNQRTGVNHSNITSNTSRTNTQPPTVHQPRTNYNTSSNSTNTNHWGWIAIVLIVAAAFLSPDIRGWVATQINQSTNNPIQNNQPPQLTPKEVITKYYQLAPSNRTEAKALLSDALKAAHRENNPNSDGKSSFWDEMKSVEIYSLKTEKESSSNHQIRVVIKYIYKNGETSCESEMVEVILDSSKGQWLINKVYDVEYNQYCGG